MIKLEGPFKKLCASYQQKKRLLIEDEFFKAIKKVRQGMHSSRMGLSIFPRCIVRLQTITKNKL